MGAVTCTANFLEFDATVGKVALEILFGFILDLYGNFYEVWLSNKRAFPFGFIQSCI